MATIKYKWRMFAQQRTTAGRQNIRFTFAGPYEQADATARIQRLVAAAIENDTGLEIHIEPPTD